jgi:hypothetical protein
MWSLGKVFCSPEVCRVYLGSFNTAPINREKNPECVGLFEREQEALLEDLHEVGAGSGGGAGGLAGAGAGHRWQGRRLVWGPGAHCSSLKGEAAARSRLHSC